MPSRVGASSHTFTSVWSVLQGGGCTSPIEAANKGQDKLSGAQVTLASSTMPSHTPKFTSVLDINTDPGCGKTMAIDMVLGVTLGLNITMSLADSADHSEQCAHSDSLAQGTNMAHILGIHKIFGRNMG